MHTLLPLTTDRVVSSSTNQLINFVGPQPESNENWNSTVLVTSLALIKFDFRVLIRRPELNELSINV